MKHYEVGCLAYKHLIKPNFRDLMTMKPSEYWQRQCKATFQYDVIGPMLVNTNNLMTEDTLMWGSDYPHTDGIWPESDKYIAEQFAGLSQEQIKKITCDNAVEFYSLAH
ncbi:MAG: amidohydrolase family protein [Planctomycetota bacterium]